MNKKAFTWYCLIPLDGRMIPIFVDANTELGAKKQAKKELFLSEHYPTSYITASISHRHSKGE